MQQGALLSRNSRNGLWTAMESHHKDCDCACGWWMWCVCVSPVCSTANVSPSKPCTRQYKTAITLNPFLSHDVDVVRVCRLFDQQFCTKQTNRSTRDPTQKCMSELKQQLYVVWDHACPRKVADTSLSHQLQVLIRQTCLKLGQCERLQSQILNY